MSLSHKSKWRRLVILKIAVLILGTITFFQNCSKVNFSKKQDSPSVILATGNEENSIVPEQIDLSSETIVQATQSFDSDLGLGCDNSSPAAIAALSSNLPTDLPASQFSDSLDNYGQDWRFSPPIALQGRLELWTKSPNSGYRLNGTHSTLKYGGTSCGLYYAVLDLKAGDSVQVGSVSNVWGASVNWVVIGHNGALSVWKNTTHDYSLTGGHNSSGAIQGGTVNGQPRGYKCSGNLIKTMSSSNWVSEGGCADYAQANVGVLCGEVPSGNSSINECLLYDGPAVKGGTDLSFHVLIFEPLADFLARP